MSNSQSTRVCYTCHALARTPGGTDLRLFGTWDFKWSHGHTVVVAFQRIVGDSKDELLTRYKDLFKAAVAPWRDSGASIKFTFANQDLPPPVDAQSAQSQLDGHALVNYDVLVSFAQLRQRLPRTERDPEGADVDTQSSELGSYARRVDYGVPTLFVGPAFERSAEQHLEDSWFAATACHEFGHALGLAHTHQNPRYRANPKAESPKLDEDTFKDLQALFPASRPPNGQAEIEEEIELDWPHVGPPSTGAIPFSDWLDVPLSPALDQVSVMTHFGWSIISRSNTLAPLLTRPTQFDYEQLRAVYPPK
jgi:hypothetical protein